MIRTVKENPGRERSADTGEHQKEDYFDLAIVGGGFSGLCTAWHILAREGLPPGFRFALIEPGEHLGAGVAYRTDSPSHLLNVRARGMSITACDSGSFMRWLSEAAPEFGPDDFVPRGLYRRYISDCLDRAVKEHPGLLTVLRDEVVAVVPQDKPDSYQLVMKSGRSIRAGAVVLAVGNLPQRQSFDNGLLHSPWDQSPDYRHMRTLAIVGAGLTALDVILEAEASGFSGKYFAISPHGRFPCTHREPFVPVPAELRRWAEELATARPKLRPILRAFQQKRKSGFHWEHLVDSLRRRASDIWSGFDTADKRLFLRRLRCLWNIHLHRSCQRTMQVITNLRDSGRLEHINARVTAVEKPEGCVGHAIRLLLNSETTATLDVDAAVNGTGLFSNIMRTDSALVAQLLADGIAAPDEFHLGLKVNGGGRLLSADGTIRPGLFTIGTMRRGEELECTAVPEIRRQVAEMVDEIAGMAGQPGSFEAESGHSKV